VYSDYGWESSDETEANQLLFPYVCGRIRDERESLRVLDIGCGNGGLARRLSAMGHDVLGIDISGDGVRLAPEHVPSAGFRVASIYNEDFHAQVGADFDVVTALEVIEHLFRPAVRVERAKSALKPGGLFLFSNPYLGYLKNLALSLLNAWDRHFTVDWEGGHITFFSKRSLEKLLRDSGFRQIAFTGAGRAPLLWKSMLMEGRK